MIQKTWATLHPGDRVLGRNAGTVTDITPAHNGDGLLVRYADGTARNVREPWETVCVVGVFAGQGLGLGGNDDGPGTLATPRGQHLQEAVKPTSEAQP